MIVQCLQEQLSRGLSVVSRAVAQRSTLPVLANVLIATDSGRLKLSATNLELGVTTWIGAAIEAEGAISVPGRLLSDIVNSLPPDRLSLSLDSATQTLHLGAGSSSVLVKGIEADEFPVIPTVEQAKPAASISAVLLREAIAQVAYAAATDDTRPVLTGVALHLRGDVARFAASNGFRLAQRDVALAAPTSTNIEVIVPARTLVELAKMLVTTTSDLNIVVTASGGQILFQTDTLEVVSRLIDGKFPDIARIIPSRYDTRAVLDRQEFAKAMKLASYFATASANIVQFDFTIGDTQSPGRLTIHATAAELGENETVREGVISGAGGQVLLNAAYVNDVVQAISTAQIAVETQSSQSPAVFKPVGVDDFLCVIMPMHRR